VAVISCEDNGVEWGVLKDTGFEFQPIPDSGDWFTLIAKPFSEGEILVEGALGGVNNSSSSSSSRSHSDDRGHGRRTKREEGRRKEG